MRILTPALVAMLSFAAGAHAEPATKTTPPASLTPFAEQRWRPFDPAQPKGPQVAIVWGDMTGPTGFLFRAPAGFKAGVHAHSDDYYGTVVAGRPAHGTSPSDARRNGPGTTWFQPAKVAHYDACTGPDECVLLLVFPRGPVDFVPAGKEPAGAR